jgi:hypothetical protein
MQGRPPLTEIARKALVVVQNRSRREGLDPFEELNRVGLIATAERIQEIQIAALKNMLDRLEISGETELLATFTRGNSNPPTAMDMYRSVTDWVRAFIESTSRY